MDRQRAPQKTRRLSPSGPAHQSSANDRRPRADRSSSPENYRDGRQDLDQDYRGRPGSQNGARHGRRNGSRNGAPNGRRGTLRQFGDRMREFTGRMPLVGRATGFRRRQRYIDDGWRRAEYDADMDDREQGPAEGFDIGPDAGGRRDDVPGLPPPDVTGDPGAFGDGLGDDFAGGPGLADDGASWAAGGSRGGRRSRNGSDGIGGGGMRIPLTARNVSIKAVIVLALLSVIVGFCCTQSTLTMLDVVSSALDARAQVTAIEAMIHNGGITNVDHLKEMQTRLDALDGDLARIQGALPGPVVNTSAGTSLNNTLTMAHDLVQAGRYGVDAALLLLPNLKGALTDVGNSAGTPSVPPVGTTPGASPAPTATATATPTTAPAPPGGLTMADVQRAQNDITMAGILAQRAIAERQSINDQQLNRIGLGSIVSILHKMDALAPQLPKYLGYAQQIMPALPDLLGVTRPAHFLLFNMDSDEMRPTGGFMGNYALITVQNGRLVGGVHLKDTFAFDCPGGLVRCEAAGPPVPDQYAWMNAFPDSFRMRDSNISPDFPTSAKLVMQKFQDEGGPAVDGVIMMTPEIIKDILKVTGSLTVPGVTEAVTAADLQDVIHYSHIANRNNFTGDKKAIDAALGSALLHKVGALSAQQQSTLMKSILAGFKTKDLQVYFNDPHVEGLVQELHMASAIPMLPGQDGLMVTDTNVGATYYNRDMEEKVTDTITFDSQGNAIHDMTMTYKLPLIQHSWTKIYVDNNGNSLTWYTGITRILVPDGSAPINPSYLPDGTTTAMQVEECNITANQPYPPCPLAEAPEPNHVVWAVRFNNMQVGTDSVTLRMQWTTPNVLRKSADGSLQYNLEIYKQAGSHIAYDITIIPPKNQKIAQPLTDPLRTPNGGTASASAEFISPSLVADTLLTVTFTGS